MVENFLLNSEAIVVNYLERREISLKLDQKLHKSTAFQEY